MRFLKRFGQLQIIFKCTWFGIEMRWHLLGEHTHNAAKFVFERACVYGCIRAIITWICNRLFGSGIKCLSSCIQFSPAIPITFVVVSVYLCMWLHPKHVPVYFRILFINEEKSVLCVCCCCMLTTYSIAARIISHRVKHSSSSQLLLVHQQKRLLLVLVLALVLVLVMLLFCSMGCSIQCAVKHHTIWCNRIMYINSPKCNSSTPATTRSKNNQVYRLRATMQCSK